MSRLILADNDTIMDIWLNRPVLSNTDIMRLFHCQKSAALRLKKDAQKLMEQKGLDSYTAYTVDTATAFEAWHIDIKSVEKRYLKKQKLKERGVIT